MKTPEEFVSRTAGMAAAPSLVTLPFLSILGAGDSPVFAAQARAWDQDIRSTRKSFVVLDAAIGADGHVQVNNRLRLAQETAGWLGEILEGSEAEAGKRRSRRPRASAPWCRTLPGARYTQHIPGTHHQQGEAAPSYDGHRPLRAAAGRLALTGWRAISRMSAESRRARPCPLNV